MAKIKYVSKSMHNATRKLFDEIVQIVDGYEQRGFKLTIRQMFYQLVSRKILPNEEKAYKKTSKILEIGRMIGEVDWDTVADRARVPLMRPEFSAIGEFVDAVKYSYMCPRWEDQDYVEVIVEKEALRDILEETAAKYNVSLLANKGYSSASTMHEVATRMLDCEQDKECIIPYMGDHDPSGVDMPRDIRAKLERFGSSARVDHITLGMDQIEQYNLPPNPAKTDDQRASECRAKYGRHSWDLDALDPYVLVGILTENTHKYLDSDKYNVALRRKKEKKQNLSVPLQRSVWCLDFVGPASDVQLKAGEEQKI